MKNCFYHLCIVLCVLCLFSCSSSKTDIPMPTTDYLEHYETEYADSLSKESLNDSKKMAPMAGEPESLGRSASVSKKSGAARNVPSSSGLNAGFSDDNKQFNYFLSFLDKFKDSKGIRSFDISERRSLKLVDNQAKPLLNADVVVKSGKYYESGKTGADGIFRFYPSNLEQNNSDITITASYNGTVVNKKISKNGARNIELVLQCNRNIPSPLPLDICFVMDTTGSMGEEIDRLKATIEIIYNNLAEIKPRLNIRFGLVLYKDIGDEYNTKIVPFTSNLDAFQKSLDDVKADGGGDYPENLEAALENTLKLKWNKDGLRLAFVVTDAPAHVDYDNKYTYINAALDAKKTAIKIHTIGTGGLSTDGEYHLRQIAQISNGRYIFLSYGERGESDGGEVGSVSHHTGDNYQTDKLEAIIIKFVKEEVSFQSDKPLVDDEYFLANKIDSEKSEETLKKLFEEALSNLTDYSSYKISKETPCAVLPVAVSDDKIADNAKYFEEQLILASASGQFTLVERANFGKILEELELQLNDIFSSENVAKAGQLLGAELLVSSTLYKKADCYELYLRLIRVSTAEVLSVAKTKIDFALGL